MTTHADGMTSALRTEGRLPAAADLDRKTTAEIVELINREDQSVALAVQQVLPDVVRAVDRIVAALQNGGRLFYVGAGTSGRLGVLDAAECPPTYGVPPELIQGLMAGGKGAVFRAREGAEDNELLGARALARCRLTARDVVCAVSSSGRTPYAIGALRQARRVGAATLALYCNPGAPLGQYADISMVPQTGPEVVAGSTRMKAGTAQKMVLNMLSTATMVRLGRVSGNAMSHMRVSCGKLRYRAERIVMEKLGIEQAEATRRLELAQWDLARALGTTPAPEALAVRGEE
jgi:N-acetylmuramic acid 6-phosphate etherase